jgi:hypothetical protein
MNTPIVALELEVEEVERRGRPGCGNSSSTNPRCTCIPLSPSEES